MTKGRVVFCAVALLFSFVSSGSAKLTPPEDLKTVFMNLLRLEDLLEEKNWVAVTPMVDDFAVRLFSVTSKIKTDLGKDLWCDPSARFNQLENAVKSQDFDRAYKSQIEFQVCLFGIMDSYAYKFHPSLLALNKYLDEAIEGCEARKADVVSREMDEIDGAYLKARPSLKEGDIPDEVILLFEENIQSVRASLGRLDYEACHRTLREMKRSLDSMLQMLNM